MAGIVDRACVVNVTIPELVDRRSLGAVGEPKLGGERDRKDSRTTV